ncbi:extracellular solute-binding protein [Actinoalloteichus hymeniacidonis]|uniref:ABC-type sugar transport system, periplasmic component n=1 Tax=Actinoalloteichus hymeniacidonis TaxID=340345 RepID=A0AAC9HTG0_9PSEU|nr:extracellular solute-binding protein [Actinoalloteichus hymeniacidonis]AOS64190.1 ABC-type sugar transport system, periplasmic component [Actinoalloteichus hymeniacidonis]MBB5907742.1 multiple sugar transport system substrate-binding protein [Actinoalloteichus hymeniacidonis]
MDRRSLLKAAALGLALPGIASLTSCAGPRRRGAVRFEGWDYEAQLVQQNIDRFIRMNPDVEVDYAPITSAQFIQKLTAEFMGGGGPDVLYMYDDSLASSVEARYLQPLDELDGIDGVYDKIYPSVAEAMTYQGKRYGLPYYTDSQALVYNSDILGQAGFDTPPTTLDELEEQALAIKDAGLLEHPIGLPAQLSDTALMWIWALVYANEADLFDEELQPVMNQAGSITTEVLEWLRRVSADSQVLDPASVQTLPVPMDNAMMAGQYAFSIQPRYSLRNYNDPAVSNSAGVLHLAAIPSLDGRTEGTVSNSRMYCLNLETEVQEKSERLLHYMGGLDDDGEPYTARFWFLERGLGYAFEDLAEDPEIVESLSTFADPETYAYLASVSRARSVVKVPWYAEFEASLQRTVQQVLTGDRSPQEGSAELERSARSLAQRYE